MKAYECPGCSTMSLVPTGGFLHCGQCGYAITAVALAAEQRFHKIPKKSGVIKSHGDASNPQGNSRERCIASVKAMCLSCSA